MQTRSRRPSLRSLGLPGLALLPLLSTSAALAIEASDPPPPAPGFAVDANSPTASVFLFSGGQATIQFLAPVADAGETLGYRVYLGSAPRTNSTPFTLGNTPCDVGTNLTTNLAACYPAVTTNGVYLAVTAYNQFGNESDYSSQRAFVPIGPPTVGTLAAGAANSREITLPYSCPATPPGVTGVTRTIEIFRRTNATGVYTKLNVSNPAGPSFTDSLLDRDTSYEYTFRCKATPPAVNGGPVISTYSASVVRSMSTVPDVFNVAIPGNRTTATNAVTTLVAGERAVINGIGGRVRFSNESVQDCEYEVGPGGMTQQEYDDNALICYNTDHCTNEPIPNANHAALLLKIGSNPTQVIGASGGSFTSQGAIFLFVNDCSPNNNTMGFTATVTVSKQ